MSVPISPSRGPGSASASANQRRLLILAVIVVLVVLLVRSCAGGQNRYEKIANQLTSALQSNDLDAVTKLQNAETATDINRGKVGRAADFFAPLGKIKSVKETTPSSAAARVHEFTVTLDKGVVNEMMKLDPQDKIVAFRYEPTTAK